MVKRNGLESNCLPSYSKSAAVLVSKIALLANSKGHHLTENQPLLRELKQTPWALSPSVLPNIKHH